MVVVTEDGDFLLKENILLYCSFCYGERAQFLFTYVQNLPGVEERLGSISRRDEVPGATAAQLCFANFISKERRVVSCKSYFTDTGQHGLRAKVFSGLRKESSIVAFVERHQMNVKKVPVLDGRGQLVVSCHWSV
jgi:hypothetical protein